MTTSISHVATIEGIAEASTGTQVRYCDAVPDYASGASEYLAGLAWLPSGVGAKWAVQRNTASIATWSLTMRRGVGPVDWEQLSPQPIDWIDQAGGVSDASVGWAGRRTNTQAGIDVGDILYADRETVRVTSATGGSTTRSVARGQGGSTADSHADGAALYTRPPALVGREVLIYRTPRTGGSASDETLLLRGVIADEPEIDQHWVSITIVAQLGDLALGRTIPQQPEVVTARWETGAPDEAGHLVVRSTVATPDRIMSAPITGGAGTYWWIPDLDIVIPAEYDADNGFELYDFDAQASVWSAQSQQARSQQVVSAAGGQVQGAYFAAWQVIWSGARDTDYPVFGYEDPERGYVRSANPVDILLNLLLSSAAGDNALVGDLSWDRGTALWPDYSLDLPIARLDMASFRRARSDLQRAPARWLWLGGPDPVLLSDLVRRLLGPFGWVLSTRRTGYALIRLEDVYPGGDTVTLDGTRIAEPERGSVRGTARTLDRVIVGLRSGPDGQAYDHLEITEEAARRHYPRNIGAAEEYRVTPYDPDDLVDGAMERSLMASRISRLSQVHALIRQLAVTSQDLDDVDVGVAVSITDQGIADPETGTRGTSVKARVTDVAGLDMAARRARISAIATGQIKLGRYSLAARVANPVNYDSGGVDVDVELHAVSELVDDSDAERLAALTSAEVILLDSEGEARSDLTGTHVTTVASAPAPYTLRLAAEFEDAGGSAVVPHPGDWIVYTVYDESTTEQTDTYAYLADGGASGSTDTLGAAGDSAYVWGD